MGALLQISPVFETLYLRYGSIFPESIADDRRDGESHLHHGRFKSMLDVASKRIENSTPGVKIKAPVSRHTPGIPRILMAPAPMTITTKMPRLICKSSLPLGFFKSVISVVELRCSKDLRNWALVSQTL